MRKQTERTFVIAVVESLDQFRKAFKRFSYYSAEHEHILFVYNIGPEFQNPLTDADFKDIPENRYVHLYNNDEDLITAAPRLVARQLQQKADQMRYIIDQKDDYPFTFEAGELEAMKVKLASADRIADKARIAADAAPPMFYLTDKKKDYLKAIADASVIGAQLAGTGDYDLVFFNFFDPGNLGELSVQKKRGSEKQRKVRIQKKQEKNFKYGAVE